VAKILLVEDHEDSRDLVKLALEIDGHTVTDVITGEDGVRIAREFTPDLIILDISLAGEIDGIETLRRLRAIPELDRVPVVALTAHAMPSDQRAILDAGFDKYLTKPIVDFEEFKEEIRRGIEDGRTDALEQTV